MKHTTPKDKKEADIKKDKEKNIKGNIKEVNNGKEIKGNVKDFNKGVKKP
jgi:hypothetical protein